jgi:GNAT superfamily N-acetyltransferase
LTVSAHDMKPLLRSATEADFEFAFQAKKDALGPHIRARWNWDEAFQRSVHKERWSEKPWYVVVLEEESIGTVAIHEQPDFARFGEFYLLTGFIRRGIGSLIVADFVERCDELQLPARLEYLKWSPVGSLYERHGFKVISENDIHYFMVREPKKRAHPQRERWTSLLDSGEVR